MEARNGEQAKAPKQRRQGKSGNGARAQNTASHDEELAAQLAKIERELRRKERKLEKYNKVLKAKEHVRNTLRQHSAASEGCDRASTDTPAQNTPPRPTKPCSSRSVTFSTKSPEVQYITTRCHTPTDRDRGTTPPPPHAKEEAVRSSEVPRGSCEGAVGVSVDVPVKEGSGLKGRVKEKDKQGSVGSKSTGAFSDKEDDFVGSKDAGVSGERDKQGSLGSKSTGAFSDKENDFVGCKDAGVSRERDKQGSNSINSEALRGRDKECSTLHNIGVEQGDINTDATLALLSNEEVEVCVQAIIQDTDCMEHEAETDTNHLSTHADQVQRSKVTGTVDLSAPESTSDLAVMESYGQCFDDWLPILPTLSPEPVPGGNGEQCPASKSLPDASGGGKQCGSSPKHCCSIQSLPGLNTDTKEVCVSSKPLPGSSATTHHYSTPKSLPGHRTKCESTPTSLPCLNTDIKEVCVSSKSLSGSSAIKHHHSTPKSLPGHSTNSESTHTSLPGPSTKCESTPTSLPGPNADTKEVCVSSKSLPGSSASTHHYSTPKSLPNPGTKSESTPTSLLDPNTRHTCSPRPLSCHQPPQKIETSVREQDKTGRQRNGSPPHLSQDTVAGEKLHSPDLFRTQFPDEEVQRSCVTQHRWRGRALQSSTESSGSFSSKRNAANPTRVRKKVRSVIDETQDLVVDEEKEGNDEGLAKRDSSRGLELVREIIQETEDMVIDEGEDGITNGEKQGNEEIVKRESCYGEGDMREVIEETEELITYDGRKRTIKESMKRENWFSVEDRREIIEETEDMIIEEEEKEAVPKLEKRGKQTQVKNIKSVQLTKEPKHFNTSHLTSLEHRHQDTSPSKNTHRGREGGENCNTSQSNKREMRIRAGLEEPQCGRTNTTNTTTFTKTKAAPKRNSHSRKNSAGKILAFLDKNAVKKLQIKPENTTDITTRTSTPKRNQEHTPDIHTDTHTDTDKSTLSLTSSIPSARLVEGPQGTEVEAWTVPVDERHGVLLTTSLATTPTSCVLLVVQECGLGLWGPSAGAEGWVLLGKTRHSIRDIANLRDVRVEGLPSGEEGRFLMVAQREGEEQVEVVYVQVSLCGKDWQLSSAPLKLPVSAASSLSLSVVGEWSVLVSWVPQDSSDKPFLTLLDLDLTYSRRGKKWELVCRPSACSLPAGGGGGGSTGVTALLSESGISGVVVCWSAKALTLFDPWQDAVIGCISSPVTSVLWAVAVKELLFVVGPRPGEPDLTLTAINPMTGCCDPFLTFSLSKGTTGVPAAALMEGGSLWRLTGVCLLPDRLTISFSGGHGVCVYFMGRGEVS